MLPTDVLLCLYQGNWVIVGSAFPQLYALNGDISTIQ